MMSLVKLLIPLLLMGTLENGIWKDKASVLITSAEISQVNHPQIEMYYANSQFGHHKTFRLDRANETSDRGSFVLDSNNERALRDTKIRATYTMLSESQDPKDKYPKDYSYTFDITGDGSFIEKLPVGLIPKDFRIIEEGKLVEQISVTTADDLTTVLDRYFLLPQVFVPDPNQPKQEDDTPVEPKGKYAFAPATRSYLVEIGSQAAIEARLKELLKGTDLEKPPTEEEHEAIAALMKDMAADHVTAEERIEAGKSLWQEHFGGVPLKITISNCIESDDKDKLFKQEVTDYYIAASVNQDTGALVLPIIGKEITGPTPSFETSPAGRNVSLPAPTIVRGEKGEITGFQFDATEFIQKIFKRTINTIGVDPQTNFICMINEKRPDDSACKATKSGEETKYTIHVSLAATEKDQHPQPNEFFLCEEDTLDNIHMVTIGRDFESQLSPSRNTPPIRIRKITDSGEDLR